MDRRVDGGTLRTGLDEVLASAQAGTRIVVQKNGRDTYVLTRVEHASDAVRVAARGP